jgi:hypothetical protein
MMISAWWFQVISQHIIIDIELSPLSIVGSIQNRVVDRRACVEKELLCLASRCCHGRAGRDIFSFTSPAIEIMQHFGHELRPIDVRSNKWHVLNRLNYNNTYL